MKTFCRSKRDQAKDIASLLAALLIAAALLGLGGYGIWLDIQAKRALIKMGEQRP